MWNREDPQDPISEERKGCPSEFWADTLFWMGLLNHHFGVRDTGGKHIGDGIGGSLVIGIWLFFMIEYIC